MQVLDDAPLGAFHKKLIVACAGGPFLDGFILTVIGVVLVSITTDLNLSPAQVGLTAVSALVGMVIGGLCGGALTDRLGRRKMYTLDLTLLLAGSLACMIVENVWQLALVRFILGAAVAADYPIATSLMTEWLPSNYRAKAIGYVVVAWYAGAIVAPLIGILVLHVAGDGAWRWVLASGAPLALIVLILRHGTPESPRWLMNNGRADEARVCVATALGLNPQSVKLPELTSSAETQTSPQRIRHLFKPPYFVRTLYVATLYTCCIVPIWMIELFGPRIFSLAGATSLAVAILGAVAFNVVCLVANFPAMKLLEAVGRRPLVIWSFALSLLPLLALAVWPDPPVIVVALMFLLFALAAAAPNLLTWLYPNELFPTSVRATAVGVGVASSRFGVVIVTYIVPFILATYGLRTTMAVGVFFTVIGLLVSIFWAEETKGKTLESSSARVDNPSPAETSKPPRT